MDGQGDLVRYEDPDANEPEVELEAKAKKPAKKVASTLDPDIFGDVTVELSASLGQGSMSVHQLVNLTDGEVITLDTQLNGLVDLSLNGRIVARGEIVSVGDQFGVRISEIVARKQ